MTLDAAFNEELAEVDGTKSFSETLDTSTYGVNEFSVSGYAITAGSDTAMQHGAVEALYQLGYRFWSPYWIKRPSSLPSGGVTIAKGERWMPYGRIYNNYGFHPLNSTTENTAFSRWAKLHAMDDLRRPIGHAWPTWFDDDRTWFDANPTYWIWKGPGDANPQFVLDSVGEPAIWEAMAQRAALYLSTRLNDENRASWDPFDTNGQDSDVVFLWVKRVVDILRTTYAITDAKLGVYAYASQVDPAPLSGEDLTGIYGQVALGFNTTDLTYDDLVTEWSNLLDEVAIRGYGDVAAFEDYLIPAKTGVDFNLLSFYTSWKALGVNGSQIETSSSWLKNAISHHVFHRHMATGTNINTLHATAVSEIVDDVFGGDAAVGELFDYWNSLPSASNNLFILKESWDIVDTMSESGWHKERFEQFLALQVYLNKHVNYTGTKDGPYYTRLEKALRWARAMWLEDGSVHDYAIARRIAGAGTVLADGRSDLYVLTSGYPHYMRFNALPTTAEIAEVKAELERDTIYPDITKPPANFSDWVEVDVAPTGSADVAAGDAVSFLTDAPTAMIYSGSGTVTITNNTNDEVESTTSYSGLVELSVDTGRFVEWSSGTMYLLPNPRIKFGRMDPLGTVWWLYFPQTVKGWHLVECDNRLELYDSGGNLEVSVRKPPYPAGDSDPLTIKTGVVCLHWLTIGDVSVAGINPTISSTRTKALMPRSLAEREGLV